MPLRLLGFAADLENLTEIAGRAFPWYAGRGVAVTVACASGAESSAATTRARLLGIQALMLLDYRPAERWSPALTELFGDIIRATQPHVVVLSAGDAAITAAGTQAFDAARQLARGSGGLPAKLYIRVASGSRQGGVSTTIAVGAGPTASTEPFQRLFPSPWVTGVVERDLFAGFAGAAEATPLDQLLAS